MRYRITGTLDDINAFYCELYTILVYSIDECVGARGDDTAYPHVALYNTHKQINATKMSDFALPETGKITQSE